MKKDNTLANRSNIENTLKVLTARREMPKATIIVFIVLYGITCFLLPFVSMSEDTLQFSEHIVIPMRSLAGVLTSLANLCIIFMVLFYKKLGFVLTLILLICVQFPSLIINMIRAQSLQSIPGLFSNGFAIVTVVIIYSNNVKIDKFQQKLSEQAVTDRLTGLPNRYACTQLVDELIRQGKPFGIVSIDLNNFKSINETMGQDAGNTVLKEVASRWKEIAENGTAGTLDFITRLSGDEFSLIIRGYYSEQELIKTIGCYVKALDEKITAEDCDFFISASFGYAEYPVDADNCDSLFLCADTAMHEVKRVNSSDHVMRYRRDMLKLEHTVEIEREIRNALDNNTLFFNLQPQFDMSHNLRGFEALARMKDSEGNNISPGEFIPVAEKVGLIDKVDSGVFRMAATFFGELIRKTGADITLSVNVSVRHLMKNNFIRELREVIESSGMPAHQLEIEITESIMIDSVDKALTCINEIKNMGIKIAIDDFGTGYSSLSYLHRFPADLLKVDKSFIDKMNTGESSKQYVASIISIGHIMGFKVISEGVEEPEQLDTLGSIGCDYIQGFIWGRPLPQDEAERLVLEHELRRNL